MRVWGPVLGAGGESSGAMSWGPSPGVMPCIMHNCRRGQGVLDRMIDG